MPATTTARGRPHLLVGNFSNQMLGLYHNEGNGLFVDEAPSSAVGRASLLSLTFGVFFFDYDLDGYPDIFAANGHIEEEIGRVQPKVQYQAAAAAVPQPGQAQVRERDARRWAPRSTAPMVARGAAYADFDRDGDLDVLISTNHGPAYLYRNDGGNRNHWLYVRPVGHEVESRRHRRGGARAGRCGKQWNMVHSGSSYCSQSDLALTFGLGKDTTVIARNRVAQRHAPAIRQRAGRPVPHHRRNPRHRQALRFVGRARVTYHTATAQSEPRP